MPPVKGVQYPGILEGNLHPEITLYISCMKTNQCTGMTFILSEESKWAFATQSPKSYIQVFIFIFGGYSKQPTVTNLKGQHNFFTMTKHKSKVPVTWEQNEMFLFFHVFQETWNKF